MSVRVLDVGRAVTRRRREESQVNRRAWSAPSGRVGNWVPRHLQRRPLFSAATAVQPGIPWRER